MPDLEARVKALEKHSEESDKVHQKIIDELHKKDIADALMRQQLDTLVLTTTRIEEKIDKQHEAAEKHEKEALAKPAKKWDAVVTTIITSVASALAGALIAVVIK